MTKPGSTPLGAIRSARATARVESLFALIVRGDDGVEGIVRRDTPSGTQPWITDDPMLGTTLVEYMKARFPDVYLVEFRRVPDQGAGHGRRA